MMNYYLEFILILLFGVTKLNGAAINDDIYTLGIRDKNISNIDELEQIFSRDGPSLVTNRFGTPDFNSLLGGVQNFVNYQIESAEKSLDELMQRTKDSLNVTGILINQLITDTDDALADFTHQIQREIQGNKFFGCVPDEIRERIIEIIKESRPDIRDCARISIKNSNRQFNKVYDDAEKIRSRIIELQAIAEMCIKEPGLGEKINCVLARLPKITHLVDEVVNIMRVTLVNTTQNFSNNIKNASHCMNKISSEAIKDINTLIMSARECATNNSIDIN